ncbi:hypothetical protein ACHAXA_002112 [Cyclostephanos tholiformis]|uniref:Uncharacterized protein n=2 Tax=Cyclostephanos tholiformis TaxID=382380 RepID=A0ABD3RAE7_9STRA
MGEGEVSQPRGRVEEASERTTRESQEGQYNKLQMDALAKRNARRRERARARKVLGKTGGVSEAVAVPSQEVGDVHNDVIGLPHLLESSTAEVDAAMVGGKKR